MSTDTAPAPEKAAPAPASAPAPEKAAPAPEAPPSTEKASTPEASSKTKTSSFIKEALSALDTSPKSTPEPTSAPTEPPTSTVEPQKLEAADTPTEKEEPPKTVPDEEDNKAEADIKRETANMSAAHKAAFTKLRYEARDLKRQLKAAAEKSESKPAETADSNVELEQLRSEYNSVRQRLDLFEKESFAARVESSEKFRSQVEEPRNAVAASVAELSKKYSDIDADSVVLAVRSGDSERVSRITADMSEFDRFQFYGLVNQYQQILSTETALRTNAQQILEDQSRESRERQEAAEKKLTVAWDSARPNSWAKIEEEFPVLAPVDGDDDWNSKLETVKSFAKKGRFEALTVQEQVDVLNRAAVFPVLSAELENALGELKAAKEQLQKYDSATPEIQSGSSVSSSASTGTPSKNFLEGALAALRKTGVQ